MPQVRIGDKDREVQRLVLVKALRAITLLNVIQKLVPDGAEQLGDFISAYRKTHVEELDRVQAKLRFGGEIPVIEDGKPVYGSDGQMVTVKAPIEMLSEEDWARAGQCYRRPEDPPVSAMVASIFPTVAEKAEQPVLRMLALFIIDNDDFRRYVRDGTWEERCDEVAREVLEPAYVEEIIDLAVVVGDMLEGSVLDKMQEVAGKARGLLARLGINLPETLLAAEPEETAEATPSQPSSESADDSTPSGSTSSASGTQDGDPTTSGPSPGTRPSPSESGGGSDETPRSSSTSEPRVPA